MPEPTLAPPVNAAGPIDPHLVVRLLRRVSARLSAVGRPVAGAERGPLVAGLIAAVLDEHVHELIEAGQPRLEPHVEARLARQLRDALTGLGGFQPLLDDPEIENISAQGCDRVFVRYRGGRRARVPAVAASDDELIELVRATAAHAGIEERRFDRGCPRLSVRLPDGSRMFAVGWVTERPCVSIRRHGLLDADLNDLCRLGTISTAQAHLLAALVRARRNIAVSGGTDSGKTTFARALATNFDFHEHIVVIEDVTELALDQDERRHPDVVVMQTREPNIEGQGGVDFTIHSSSSRQVPARLATYAIQAVERLAFEATYALVAAAVHVIVHLEKLRDGTRVLSSLREVVGFDNGQVVTNEVYRPGPDKRGVPAAPVRASTMDALIAAGLDPEILAAEGW
ncbi:CpaF family protein [Phytohabitans houttuyneae]|uniref:Protein kinase n=1 Tax=Phytohabitans houttuyneae TaxID=1076126 RepID=A0A6V8KVF2_9ACTN|nr:ATPase, T2SS/T4P/T4SS family [Phytohabitans houttuyneae]GFJ85806.1 protein kinase [Phytohabitans houttuyneae]